jgi:hypothetical protein
VPSPAVETALCFFHAHPEKLAEFGRQGGQKNRCWKLEIKVVLPDPAPQAGYRPPRGGSVRASFSGTAHTQRTLEGVERDFVAVEHVSFVKIEARCIPRRMPAIIY